MLSCVCSVIDHRRRQNVVRTSVTHLAIASCATFLFLSHFDVICDLLLSKRTATWNLYSRQSLRVRLFKKIQDWILESKNGFCVSLLNRLIQGLSDRGASKEP